MPRFAILAHDHPFLHWDLLLENGKKCRTFRLLETPDLAPGRIPAEELADHRLMYLDYEGPVSGQRGNVTNWDRGTFEWQINRSEQCQVLLKGQRWSGLARLTRTEGDCWTCSCEQAGDSL